MMQPFIAFLWGEVLCEYLLLCKPIVLLTILHLLPQKTFQDVKVDFALCDSFREQPLQLFDVFRNKVQRFPSHLFPYVILHVK